MAGGEEVLNLVLRITGVVINALAGLVVLHNWELADIPQSKIRPAINDLPANQMLCSNTSHDILLPSRRIGL